jgi:hypothetical protein
MGCSCGGRCLFVAASLVLTGAFLACGISFFGPYWISNLDKADDKDDRYITVITETATVSAIPNNTERGLWAQCGKDCTWFWENGYQLQTKFTGLKWHLATQILYFIACVCILTAEIFARVQMCCSKERSSIYISLGIIVLASALLQIAALATFGGGASRPPYNTESDPVKIGKILLDTITSSSATKAVYLGWCYWMAVVGMLLSILSGIFFLLAACCKRGTCCLNEK